MNSNKIKKYQVNISPASSEGATCTNYDVRVETPFCADIVCELNADKTEVHVEVGPGCDDPCIYIVHECLDNCVDCISRKRYCFCTTDTDCDSCSTCDQENNVCITECIEEEFCDDGRCVECNDDIPCKGNKECQNGKCVCPSETPYEDKNGNCVRCLPGTCPPCFECTPNGCKPINCGTKVCDPSKNECVECVGSADCKDPNKECKDNKCVCKEGFIEGPDGGCIEKPECENDNDCADCKVCNEFGKCVNKECDGDEVCIDDDCVIPCKNGTECPTGYGCDGEKCVKCSELDCTTGECDNVLNCGCNAERKCVDQRKDCAGDCANYTNCDDDCTCHNAECADCISFGCDECDQHANCGCTGGKCVNINRVCNDSVSITMKDCKMTGEAKIYDECGCDPLTLTIEPLALRTETDKVSYDVRAILRKGSADSWGEAKTKNALGNTNAPNIAENELPSTGTFLYIVRSEVYEVDEEGDRIGNNNFPYDVYSGFIDFINNDTKDLNNIEIYKNGAYIDTDGDPNSFHKVYSTRIIIKHTSDIDVPGSTCTYEDGTVVRNSVVTSSMFNRLMNQEHKLLEDFKTVTSSDTRNPFFRWLQIKATESTFDLNDATQAFRKMYIAESSANTYTDVLEDYSDGLYNGYKYALHVDCPCKDNFTVYGQVKECSPEEFSGTFSECGTKFKPNPIDPCIINKYVGSSAPADAQVVYSLTLDGEVPSELFGYTSLFTFRQSGKLLSLNGKEFSENTYSNGGKVIKEVQLKIFTSSAEICTLTLPGPNIELKEINHEVVCDPEPEFRIYKTSGADTITNLEVVGGGTVNGVLSDQGSYWLAYRSSTNQIPPNEITVRATFSNSCVVEETLIGSADCMSCNINLPSGVIENGTDVELSISISGGIGPYDIQILNGQDDVVMDYRKNSSTPSDVIIPNYLNNTNSYTVVITDSVGSTCEKQISDVGVNANLVIQGNTICEGGQGIVSISNVGNGLDGGKIVYNVNNGPNEESILGTGSNEIEIPTGSSNVNVEFTELRDPNNNIVTSFQPQTVTIEVIERPNLTSVTVLDQNDNELSQPDVTYCENTPYKLRFKGTPGATVEFSGDSQSSITETLNGSGVGTYIVSNGGSNEITWRINKISLDNCERNLSNEINITFTAAPEVTTEARCDTRNGNRYSYAEFGINGIMNFDNLEKSGDYENEAGVLIEEISGVGYDYYRINRLLDNVNPQENITFTYTVNGCEITRTVTFKDECVRTPLLSTVKENGCETTDSQYTINEFKISNEDGSEDLINSSNYNIVLKDNQDNQLASGNQGNLMQFPLSPGFNIPVTVELNIIGGLFSGETYNVTENFNIPSSNISISPSQSQINEGETVTFTAVGNSFSSYEWYIDGALQAGETSNTLEWVGATQGAYEIEVKGIGQTGSPSSSVCENTSDILTYQVYFSCPPSTELNENSDAVTVVNETCDGNDGSITIDEAELVGLGFTSPFTYSGGLSSNTNTGLSEGLFEGTITDDSSCIITYYINLQKEAVNQIPFNGTFENCSVGTGGQEPIQNRCGSTISDSTGTMDVWLLPYNIGGDTESFGPTGLVPSNQGGKAIGGHAYGPESFEFQVSLDASKTYEISFEHVFGGSQGLNMNEDAIGKWEITIDPIGDNIVLNGDNLSFEGFGNQTWKNQTITFSPSTTGSKTIKFEVQKVSGSHNVAKNYLLIDNIKITEVC